MRHPGPGLMARVRERLDTGLGLWGATIVFGLFVAALAVLALMLIAFSIPDLGVD